MTESRRLGPGDDPEPLKEILARIRQRHPGGNESSPPPEPKCHICGDVGWVYATTAEGKVIYGKVVPCQCRAGEVRETFVRASKLPPGDTSRMSTFEVRPGTKTAFQAAKAMAEGKAPHPFLTMVGAPGTGKTHLARAIVWEWIEQGKGSILYYSVSSLLDDLRRGYDQKPEHEGEPSGFDRLMARVLNMKLLILDDMGVEKATEWSMDKLDTIINYRYERILPTVVTTNLAAGALSDRAKSRLQEGVTVQLNTSDYRAIIAKKREKK